MSSNAVRNVAAAGAAGMILCCGLVAAQGAGPSRAEQLIKYRQAIYTVIGGNFGPMAAAVQGKAPYEPKEFATRAERVAFLARLLDEAYPEESRGGAPTKAKADIWANRAEFDRLLDDMQAKAGELAEVAKSGDMERIRPAVGATGQACKACHDKFREK